jgi:N-acetylneuraminic acid mutarotase
MRLTINGVYRWAYLVTLLLVLLVACRSADMPQPVKPTLEPPTKLQANPGNGFVGLTWTASASTDVAGYNVYRDTQGSLETKARLNTSPVTQTEFQDESVTNGTTYYYTVTAVDSAETESVLSNIASATPQAGGGAEPLPPGPGSWEALPSNSRNRQEVAYVQLGGKFYLAGGDTLHEVYDPASRSWSTIKPLPANVDHVQGVAVGGRIYYIGGLSNWPGPHVSTLYIYDPATDSFSQGAPMPRGRGAGGVAVHDGKIYYAGGLSGTSQSSAQAVAWFDVYDPATDSWSELTDMPVAKDHFHAAVVDGVFYAIGGRDRDINATITSVEAYDFATQKWSTLETELPTARSGFATAVLGREILVIGGEGGGEAFDTVEAFDTLTQTWRTLEPMPTARHGIQAAVCNGGVYVAAGGTRQGGGAPSNVHEVFFFGDLMPCTGDSTSAQQQ